MEGLDGTEKAKPSHHRRCCRRRLQPPTPLLPPPPNLEMNRQTDEKTKKPSQVVVVVVPNRPTVRPYHEPPPNLGTDGRMGAETRPRSQAKPRSCRLQPTDQPTVRTVGPPNLGMGGTDGRMGQRRPRGQEVVVSNQPTVPWTTKSWTNGRTDGGREGQEAKKSSSPTNRPHRGPPNLGMGGTGGWSREGQEAKRVVVSNQPSAPWATKSWHGWTGG
ncbi:hypothetical protein ml_513 [Mollivirus sibericum]|uniref:hypothetical protein n=1 Tax=Mollivirus sibericum TaxID=1678078 RepID=UPI0006B2DC2A|nr:hypothetical protein ml_11 [Mollivirus sibericum]YP_009165479.1 hypothetical protein ml_513 [Mollivirus sibericum]ALD61813.1 hypothetical protein ml_11 [Mollivirus sibericum]ALD62315.1 hypothetical protein ml_513 [Mollivirus sibericum]